MDQRKAAMQCCRVEPISPGAMEIVQRQSEAIFAKVQDPTAERGGGEFRIEMQRSIVITQGPVEPS
jgi:hypothetical protein